MAKSTPNKSPAHVTGFRPIAPSITPQQSLSPLTPFVDHEKRKWDEVDNSAFSNLTNGGDMFASLSISPIANSPVTKDGSHNHSLTNEQKLKRKEQNRAAQRAFRERKERYVKELEAKIKFLEDAHTTSLQMVQRENQELREALKRTEAELSSFKGAAESINAALKKLRESGVDVPEISIPEVSEREPKRIMRVPSSAVACIRDKDGVSFCERLKDEVCSSAYVQLLSEPLFDENGFLNAAVTEHPVPIVTGNLSESKVLSDSQDISLSYSSQDCALTQEDSQLVPCPKVWERLSEHPNFDKFDLDRLCEELKRKAKCSYDGPVFDEKELAEVISKMEASLER